MSASSASSAPSSVERRARLRLSGSHASVELDAERRPCVVETPAEHAVAVDERDRRPHASVVAHHARRGTASFTPAPRMTAAVIDASGAGSTRHARAGAAQRPLRADRAAAHAAAHVRRR